MRPKGGKKVWAEVSQGNRSMKILAAFRQHPLNGKKKKSLIRLDQKRERNNMDWRYATSSKSEPVKKKGQ